MESTVEEDQSLSELPYRELQRMAKSAGIKANLPKQSLVREILALRKSSEEVEKENDSILSRRSSTEPKCFLDFVSQRRKKRRGELEEEGEESSVAPPQKRRSLLAPLQRVSLSKKHVSSTPQKMKDEPKMGSKKKNPPTRIPRCKMPDFAKLHAKEFDKMENLETYLSKRKLPSNTSTPATAPKMPSRCSPRLQNASIRSESSQKKVPPSSSSRPKMMLNTQIPSSFAFGSHSKKGLFTFTASPSVNNKSLQNNSLAKRNNFDLKQSLAQPLKYKPHTGKIKTWEEKQMDRRAAYKSTKSIAKGSASTSSSSSKSMRIKGVRMNRRAELMLQRRKVS